MANISKINLQGTTYDVKDANAQHAQPNWSETSSSADGFIKNKPTKVSDFTNDSGFQTAANVQSAISGKADTTALNAVDTRTVEFIEGTHDSATAWTGVTKDSALYEGKRIAFFTPKTGANYVTLNLTLSGGGTTGAINVYRYGTTQLGSQVGANSVVALTYHGGKWYVDYDYDTNTWYRLQLNNSVKAAEALVASTIVVGTSAGYKKAVANVSFDITLPILWWTSALASGSTSSTYGWYAYASCTLRNNVSNISVTANNMVYLTGTLDGTTFTIKSPVFTTTKPTTADGLYYIPIGFAYSSYQINFFPQSGVYAYQNGKFQLIGGAGGGGATLTFTGGSTATYDGSTAVTVNIPNKTSDLTNDSSYATTSQVATAKAEAVAEATDGLATVATSGDYGDLINTPTIPAAPVQSDWNITSTSSLAYIKNKPANLVQDANYVHTDSNFTAAEKTKLAGIATGATKVTVDSAMSSTSTNPVQNKVIYGQLANKADSSTVSNLATQLAGKASTTELQAVADSIPENVSELTNDANYVKATDPTTAEVTGTISGSSIAAGSITKDRLAASALSNVAYGETGLTTGGAVFNAQNIVYDATYNSTYGAFIIPDVAFPQAWITETGATVKISVRFNQTTSGSTVYIANVSNPATRYPVKVVSLADPTSPVALTSTYGSYFVYDLIFDQSASAFICTNQFNQVQTADIAAAAITNTKIGASAVKSDNIDWTTFGGLVYAGKVGFNSRTYSNGYMYLQNKQDLYAASGVSTALTNANLYFTLTLPTNGQFVADVQSTLWVNANTWDYMWLKNEKNGSVFSNSMGPKAGAWAFVNTRGLTTISNGDNLRVYLGTNGNKFSDGNISDTNSFMQVLIFRTG